MVENIEIGKEISFKGSVNGAEILNQLDAQGFTGSVSAFDRVTTCGKIKVTGIKENPSTKEYDRTVMLKLSDLTELRRLAYVCKNKFDNLERRFCFELISASDQDRARDWKSSINALINLIEEDISK